MNKQEKELRAAAFNKYEDICQKAYKVYIEECNVVETPKISNRALFLEASNNLSQVANIHCEATANLTQAVNAYCGASTNLELAANTFDKAFDDYNEED